MSTETGFHQLVTASPVPIPGGTRPDATPPATAPRKNGVMTEEAANAAPNRRRCQTCVTVLRNANAEPRTMIPNAARVSGMYRVEATAPNSGGKQVHSTTSTKISQTWLASQTGPMECSMSRRAGFPALRAAGGQVPEARPEVGAGEQRVAGDTDPGDRGRRVGEAVRSPSTFRRRFPAGRPAPAGLLVNRRSTAIVTTVSTV